MDEKFTHPNQFLVFQSQVVKKWQIFRGKKKGCEFIPFAIKTNLL